MISARSESQIAQHLGAHAVAQADILKPNQVLSALAPVRRRPNLCITAIKALLTIRSTDQGKARRRANRTSPTDYSFRDVNQSGLASAPFGPLAGEWSTVAPRCPKCAMPGDFTVRRGRPRRPDGALPGLRDGLARPRAGADDYAQPAERPPLAPPAADHRGRDAGCRRARAAVPPSSARARGHRETGAP